MTPNTRKDEEKILSPEFLDEIKRVRQEKGISIEELSERTNIKISYIRAIEDGDISRLPGGIYNKAYIKSVSELLGINMRPYERSVEADEVIKDREVRIEIGKPFNATLPSKLTIISCLFAIFILYSVFYGPRVSKKEQIDNAVNNYVDTTKQKAKEDMKTAKTDAEKVAIETEMQAKISDQAALIKQIPQVSPIIRDTQDIVGKELVITIVALRDAKVVVKDFYGNVILHKDMTATEAVMLNGSDKYYLIADNVNNLELYLDGVQIRDIAKIPMMSGAYILKGEDMVDSAEKQVQPKVPVTVEPAALAKENEVQTNSDNPTETEENNELKISPSSIRQEPSNANQPKNNSQGSGR